MSLVPGKCLEHHRNILRRQILTESLFVTILSLIPATFVIDSGMTFINNALNRTLSNRCLYKSCNVDTS